MLIIMNPTSRKSKPEKLLKLVAGALDNFDAFDYTIKTTSKPGEAMQIAKSAADSGEDLVLCIGGDGTVSEVAGGLAGSDTTLGIIPAGTGNDFARYLGIPSHPVAALDCALFGESRMVDAALANSHVFINAAGSGFDVQVLIRTLRYKKIFRGLLAYVLGVLASVSGYRGMDVKIEHSGGVVKTKSLLLSVANGRYIGGGMCIAPDADASDGLFEVIYVDSINRLKIPFLLAAFIKGGHMSWDIVHHFKTDKLTITTSDSSLQLDGEILSERTVNYKILPHAIKVKVPAYGGGKEKEKAMAGAEGGT